MINTFHPAIVHFPIALLLVGSVAALVRLLWSQSDELTWVVWRTLLLGWIGSVAAILSGLLAQSGLPPQAPYRGVLNIHIGTAIGVAATYAALLYMWWLRRPGRSKIGQERAPLLDDAKARWWVIALLALGMLLVVASGYYGGRLVYVWGVNVG